MFMSKFSTFCGAWRILNTCSTARGFHLRAHACTRTPRHTQGKHNGMCVIPSIYGTPPLLVCNGGDYLSVWSRMCPPARRYPGAHKLCAIVAYSMRLSEAVMWIFFLALGGTAVFCRLHCKKGVYLLHRHDAYIHTYAQRINLKLAKRSSRDKLKKKSRQAGQ